MKKNSKKNHFTLLFSILSHSGAGKTTLITKMLQNAEAIFSPSPSKILWIYSRYFTDSHQKLKDSGLNIVFYDTLDYESLIALIEKESKQYHFLVILDDALELSKYIGSIFTRDANNLSFR